MYLYNLTLQRPTAITTAIYGNFTAPKAQEIVAARGDVLELLRPDDAGRLVVAASAPAFGQLRSLAPFRLAGAPRDYVVVGSDSGRIVILEVVPGGDGAAPAFKKVHQETFGKSGVRRAVPGQYVAADPKGRSLMIAAIEKAKFVYTLNRDAASALTISSPLEAHKSRTITLAVAGLDAGYDNPVFAALEVDYTDADEDPSGEAAASAVKTLTLYELDLGLNHVVRKAAAPVDATASALVPVPGGGDGPGGVLVCCDGWVVYRGPDGDAESELRARIPRREGLPADRGTLIVATATHKQRSTFFALLQTEYGDVFKATLTVGDGNGAAGAPAPAAVTALRLSYFDTLPPAASLCVLKTGFLFAASEFGNHGLYQFAALGDDSPVESVATRGARPPAAAPTFAPTPLTNLVLIDELDSLAPMIDARVANLLREEVPQVYAACGRGARATLRLLRPGAAVADAASSPLPGAPTGVWTLRKAADAAHDAYIVASFANATLVLAVGDTVEEVADSGLAAGVATLAAQSLADGSLLQVHAGGLRHVRPDGRVAEWRSPGRRAVARAATNARQCAVALAGGEVIAFELDPATGALAQAASRDLGADVAAIDLAPVPPGRARSRFLAVAGYDATIRVVGLDPADGMKVLALQAAPAVADHLAIVDESGAGGATSLFLHAGLANGVLLRAELDAVTGQLSDARSRFLGTRPPRLARVRVRGAPALLALSSRPWLAHASDGGRHALVPLATDALDYAAPFASDAVPEGVVAVAGGTLRVLALDRVADGGFNAASTRLRYTPRRMVVHEDGGAIIVGEADHGVASDGDAMATDGAAPAGVEFDEDAAAERERVGAPRAPDGAWAACVRVVDARTLATRAVAPLGAACVTSMALVTFDSAPAEGALLAVGTATGLRFHPRGCEGGAITLFRVGPGATTLDVLHTTPLDAIPGALAPFKGRLLAGVGPSLRLFDLGRKKLLRKADLRGLPSHVVSLAPAGARVFVGDQTGSALLARYSAADGAFHVAADDAVPRHVTAALALDYDTVAVGDKFGNVAVLRLDAAASAAVEADPTGGRAAAAASAGAGGAAPPPPHQLATEACVHVGDAVTWLARAALQPGAPDALLYGTLGGRIGALTPLTTRADADFAASLEMHMRLEAPPLAGRDHLAYRSAYYPARHVADGDLCEAYGGLSAEARARVAGELDRAAGEVAKKLEDARARVL